ncbi:MAG: thioredoxin-disulfide reductase [Synechococcus sp.]
MTASCYEHRSIAIIGAGPAGYTAAVYTARANLHPLTIQGPEPGGQLMMTTDVENYPGFPQGILGPELMSLFEQQADRFGAERRFGIVTQVNFAHWPFLLEIDGHDKLYADAVIIATGATHRYLEIDGEKQLMGRGVSVCATCDGAFFKNVPVATIGGGDTAAQNALLLSRTASHVYLIHRRDHLRASQIMQQRLLSHTRITIMWNTIARHIVGNSEVEALQLENVVSGEIDILDVKGVFISIGHKPNTEVFKDWLELDDKGYIVTEPDSTRTSVPGVFACGDVQDRVYRQAVTAAGTGCMAAIDAERWLASKHHHSLGNRSESGCEPAQIYNV